VNTKAFVVETGKVDIQVGASSQDVRLNSQIDVSSGTVALAYRQDPFTNIEAEYFEKKSPSPKILACKAGGQCIGMLNNNGYVVYKNLDFSTEAKQFTASLSSTLNGASIQIVLDSLKGTVVGTLTITSTGSLDVYNTQSCTLSNVTGVRDVFLVFKTTTANAININWFSFQKEVGYFSGFETMIENFDSKIYPNPTNSGFTVNYKLATTSNVKIEVYTMQGTLVKTVTKNNQYAGEYQMQIGDAKLQPSLYVVRFFANDYSKSLILEVID
jgi:hypothetical protein